MKHDPCVLGYKAWRAKWPCRNARQSCAPSGTVPDQTSQPASPPHEGCRSPMSAARRRNRQRRFPGSAESHRWSAGTPPRRTPCGCGSARSGTPRCSAAFHPARPPARHGQNPLVLPGLPQPPSAAPAAADSRRASERNAAPTDNRPYMRDPPSDPARSASPTNPAPHPAESARATVRCCSASRPPPLNCRRSKWRHLKPRRPGDHQPRRHPRPRNLPAQPRHQHPPSR